LNVIIHTMKTFSKKLIIAAAIAVTALPLFAKDKTEEQLITDLGSPTDKVVFSAMAELEKKHPGSAAGQAKIKTLLADPRPLVHQKAARVLGALHAEVSDTDLANIAKMLEATGDKKELMEALKALRGLKAQSIAAKLVPLLQHPDANVKRDACRTLAVIGDKSMVKDIEPLLQSKEKAVVEDAQKAINALK
jgi:HEAT repeat protein